MSRSCTSYIVKWIGPSDGLSYLKDIRTDDARAKEGRFLF
jgi:hypothetical protein